MWTVLTQFVVKLGGFGSKQLMILTKISNVSIQQKNAKRIVT
jgi:hypothetical protein